MYKPKQLQEIVEKINKCSPKECKGILLFVSGYMSQHQGLWNLYYEAVKNGINANTWNSEISPPLKQGG